MTQTQQPVEIRGGIELPARREDIELQTEDGLTLVGELALPIAGDPIATLVTLHPLPTAGG
ncbi:MAG: alpha/beta hydrolase, partial [Microbacteriaceae bacterium]